MRAVLRTVLTLALGAGLVLGALHRPGLHATMAGADANASNASTGSGSVSSVARPLSRSAAVCPGPESVGVKKVDPAHAPNPTVLRVAAPPGDVTARALGAASATLPTSGSVGATALGGAGALGFTSLSAPGTGSTSIAEARAILFSGSGSLAPGLVAGQTSLVTTGDLRGLSTLSCGQPAAQTWLVGGSGSAGRRDRVILANPTPDPVTVSLAAYGAKGPIALAASARAVVVAGHQRKVLLLGAIAPGERAPVIHVSAFGGVIAATLSDAWVSGTTPSGADDVAGTSPGRTLLIPGVRAAGTPGSTVLRIAATAGAASVQIRVLGAAGPTSAPISGTSVKVPAGTVKNVDLSALPAGDVTLELSATHPIVAAVQLHPGVFGKRDLAWATAVAPVTTLAGFALGPVTAPWSATLALGADAVDSPVDITTVAADGTEATQSMIVSAGTTRTVAVAGSTSPPVAVWIQPRTGSVAAAMITTYADSSGPLLSVTPLADAPLSYRPVAVTPLG